MSCFLGRVSNLDFWANKIGCKVGSTFGAHCKSDHWDGVEEHFKKRLALWKRQCMSKGGDIF